MNLLDVARIETGTLLVAPEPWDLHTLVEEAVSRFLAGDDRNSLEVELAEDLPLVLADKLRIVQAQGNLLPPRRRLLSRGVAHRGERRKRRGPRGLSR